MGFVPNKFEFTKIFGYLCQDIPQIYKFAKDPNKKDTNIFGTDYNLCIF
jgi:hypothetical protein